MSAMVAPSLGLTRNTWYYRDQVKDGVSVTSAVLGNAIDGHLRHKMTSIYLGWRRELEDRLLDAISGSCEPGWDGYDAEQITLGAIGTAYNLIFVLPQTTPLPDIVPTPEGEIAFEWDRDEDYSFSVQTNSRSLIFAGLLGTGRKQSGQEPFSQQLPNSIAGVLAEYFTHV